jgi:ankyrin repeat protein
MDALLKRLEKASTDGDINEDPLLLDRVLTEPRDNPLRIEALQGHVDFASKILRLKSELANQLNREGQSPLHLAAARGMIIVKRSLH